jgi:phage gp29-like protein
MEPIRRLVASASSFDEVLRELEAMFPDMDDQTFKTLVGEAVLAMNMAGAATLSRSK